MKRLTFQTIEKVANHRPINHAADLGKHRVFFCPSSSAMVRAMLGQSSKGAPSKLAALRRRPDNTLRHVRRRLSQMAEAQLRTR